MRPSLAALLLIVSMTLTVRAEDPGPRKNVLVLYDENRDFAGLTMLDQGLRAGLARRMPGALDIYPEYMDISRFRDEGYEKKLAEFYRQKYAGKKLDLMIAVMAPSMDFLLKHGAEISPGTPIVFCGVDQRELAGRAVPANVTGVMVKRDFKPTLEIALRLHPKTRQVVFIAGTSPFNQYWRDEARRELSEFEPRVKINYLTDLSMDALQTEVSRLPPDTIILFLHLFRDAAGNTFTPDEAVSLIASKANAPIYVFVDQFVGKGVVGGYVYGVERHGERAAETAARILSGEKASAVPIQEVSSNLNLFDERQIRRWNIDERLLPADAVVLNRKASFWELYRWRILVVGAIIAAQSALIIAMMFQRRQRNTAELAHKRAQAEVQQKRAELTHLSRVAALGELTAGLAHELNQPLTAIISNAAAGRRLLDHSEPDIAEVRETLADISKDTQRAGDIIRRLRDMLKRRTSEFKRVDVNDVIRTVEHIVHSDAALHQVTVELELTQNLPSVMGDSVQLQQVILNLMINALAAIDKPQMEARRLLLRTQMADGSKLQVDVRDHGTGIPPDTLERIFDPFVSTKPDGLGMGLSICRSIIEHHGGKLWAANNPDGGATLSFTLPVNNGQSS